MKHIADLIRASSRRTHKPPAIVCTAEVIQCGLVLVREAVRTRLLLQNRDKSGGDLRESGHAKRTNPTPQTHPKSFSDPATTSSPFSLLLSFSLAIVATPPPWPPRHAPAINPCLHHLWRSSRAPRRFSSILVQPPVLRPPHQVPSPTMPDNHSMNRRS